jgi:hypothetical protein
MRASNLRYIKFTWKLVNADPLISDFIKICYIILGDKIGRLQGTASPFCINFISFVQCSIYLCSVNPDTGRHYRIWKEFTKKRNAHFGYTYEHDKVIMKCKQNIRILLWSIRSEVPKEVSTKIMVFWDVMLCSFIDRYQQSGGICSFTLKMKEQGSSKTLVSIYQIILCHIPGDYKLTMAYVTILIQFLILVCNL